MFANCLRVVTALTMLTHSVWGCCWHHAHDGVCSHLAAPDHLPTSEPGPGTCSHGASESHAHGEVGELPPHDHGLPDEDGHQHGPCKDIHCTFVKTTSAETDGTSFACLSVVPSFAAAVPGDPTGELFDRAAPIPTLRAPAARAMTQSWQL